MVGATIVMAVGAMSFMSMRAPGSVMSMRASGSVMSMTAMGPPVERAAPTFAPSASSEPERTPTVEGEPGMQRRMGWERREGSMMGERSVMGRWGWRGRERPMMRRWWRRGRGRERSMGRRGTVARPTSGGVLVTITFMRGCVRSERTNDVTDRLSDLSRRTGLCVARAGSRSVDLSLNIRSRPANFLRSPAEMITMRSPVGAVSNVLHNAAQRSSELGVLCEHGANHAKEHGDIARKGGVGSRRRWMEVSKRRVWSIVSGGIIGRGDFLDVDGGATRLGETVTRNFVNVNRRFFWCVVGED